MSPRSSKRSLHALLATLVVLLFSACGSGDLPQNTLDPEGPISRQLDRLWDPVFAIAAFFFVVVELGVVVLAIKYRARSDDDQPKQIHGSAKLEIAWTIVPALILAFVGVGTVVTVFDINSRATAEENALAIDVVGHQWWFEYRYHDDTGEEAFATANELVIPVGRIVELDLTAEDVIHAFWPPKLAGKVDMIPGRTNFMQVVAEEPGTYWGQCTEYCGLSHGYMRLRVIALAPEEYEEWFAGQLEPAASATDELAKEGEALITAKGCGACHTINGLEGVAGQVGPDLTHLYSRDRFGGASFDLDERNLRSWLRDPPAMKPMNPDNGQGMPNLNLTEEEITQLIAYLETLK